MPDDARHSRPPTFSPGDRVRHVRTGQEAEVLIVHGAVNSVRVRWAVGVAGMRDSTRWRNAEEFEPVDDCPGCGAPTVALCECRPGPDAIDEDEARQDFERAHSASRLG